MKEQIVRVLAETGSGEAAARRFVMHSRFYRRIAIIEYFSLMAYISGETKMAMQIKEIYTNYYRVVNGDPISREWDTPEEDEAWKDL